MSGWIGGGCGVEDGGLRGEEVRTYTAGELEERSPYRASWEDLVYWNLWDNSRRWIWTGVLAEISERILGWGLVQILVYTGHAC